MEVIDDFLGFSGLAAPAADATCVSDYEAEKNRERWSLFDVERRPAASIGLESGAS
jgi:hypothetical protein